jgi:rusticyanin
MKRTRSAAAAVTAAIAAAGLGAGLIITACGATGQAPASASAPGSPAYSYYRSMMGRLYPGTPGSMMNGTPSRGWTMGGPGYRWMTGGLAAPAWMRGRHLPGYMMTSSGDAGKVMGTLFADSPGARVRPARAAQLGSQVPAGATASRARHRITISGTNVRLTVLASPPGGPDETFRIAGMVNPAIVVTAGARVSIEIINSDADTAHGLIITASHTTSAWMPMMTATPAFPGSALWFLGDPTPAGMHAGTLSFTASTPGTYHYLCPVPGHAQKGMTGTFIVSSTT